MEYRSVGRTASVTNQLTVGESDEDLFLTFTFSNDAPILRDEAKADEFRQHGLKAVISTIGEIRQMVVEGRVS